MKHWRSLLCLLLCLLMVASLCACGGKDKDGKNESGTGEEGGNAVALTDTVNQYGWTVPEETMHISYYDASGQVDQDNENERLANIHQVVLDEFNIDFEKIVYEEDSVERLNLMLTSQEYPEVIVGMGSTMARSFIEQDRAVNLTEMLKTYAPNVLDGIGDYIGFLEDEDGQIYQLPWDWGHNTDYMGKTFSIRNDMLREVGLENPNSFESYYEAVKKLVEAYPTNAYGEQTYGITAFSDKGREFYSTPLGYLGLFSSPTGLYKVDDDNKITYWVDTDEGRFVAQYINRFWRDGLIDPDFQTKDYDSALAFMSNERVVANIGIWWHNLVGGIQVWEPTQEDWTIEKRMIELGWQEEGYDVPRLVSDSFIRDYRTIITDNCDIPEEVVLWWNWECTPVANAFLSMGAAGDPEDPNTLWWLDENGDVTVQESYWYGNYPAEWDGKNWDEFEDKSAGAFNYWMVGPGYVSETYKDNRSEGYAEPIIAANMWDLLPDFEKLDTDRLSSGQLSNMYNLETCPTYMYDATLWNINWTSDSEINDIYLSVNEKLLQDWCLCITAETEEECDALYDQMVQDLHDLGLDDMVEAQQAAYDINCERLGTTAKAE